MENDRAFAEVLNDCLDAIEAGQASVEDCLTRYPQVAARLEDLLRLSDETRTLSFPAPTPEVLAAGERQLVQAARSRAAEGRGRERNEGLLAALSRQFIEPVKAALSALPKWVLPVAALSGGAALLFICVTLVAIGGALGWRGLRRTDAMPDSPPVAISEDERNGSPMPSPTVAEGVVQYPSPLPGATAIPEADDSEPPYMVFLPLGSKPLSPHLAVLEEIQGVVKVQGVDGTWSLARDGQTIGAGIRVRTGALSRVELSFYDGSTAYLGPDTELSIDALGQDPEDQSRIVELTQRVGETDHDVAPSYGTNARYEVHTPSGTGEAKGTLFHVSVTLAQIVRFRVDDGAVAVTHLDVTVVVVAGQSTTIHGDEPPAEPVFRVTGEGELEAMGTIWRIAGQDFRTDQATVIVGSPQIGDWVHVEGHLLADGTRVADWIVLLRRAPANRFTIVGEVQATGIVTWTVAGQEIAVDDTTAIDEGIQIGDRVRVEGVIRDHDGALLLAETIVLIDEQGLPFSFVGVVQEIAEAYWLVSGISVTVDSETVIDPDLVVADVVRVRGVFLDLEGGTWLARSIEPVVQADPMFAFTGTVDATGPVTWTVAGQEIAVDDATEIDEGIEVGDLVRVRGRIDDNGVLFAESIHLVAEPTLSFVFVGTVEEISGTYWTVSGVSVTVDAETVVDGDLGIGDVVQVRGRAMADGTWLARSIRRLLSEAHEFEFVGLVERIDPWVVSGIPLETRPWTEIEDEIEVGDRVKVEGRILPDGTWLAEEIELVDADRGLSFEFVGIVQGIDPWVVSGISLTVNAQTEILGQIEVGDWVKVDGRILPDGTWLATEIKPIDRGLGRGCMLLTSLVVRVSATQVVLHDGTTIPLDTGVHIDGKIQVNSVIVFYVCVDDQGNVTIVSIIVLYQTEPVIIVLPPPSGDDDRDDDEWTKGKVTICHKPQAKSGHTIVVAWPAWINGHSKHGDTLGPCK